MAAKGLSRSVCQPQYVTGTLDKMADEELLVRQSELFEFSEEECIFRKNDHFLYHKYRDECKETTSSFLEPNLASPLSGNLYLHQHHYEPLNARLVRSAAMNHGSNVLSVCFSSVALTDEMMEGILPHLSRLQYLQFNDIGIGPRSTRAMSMFCHSTLKSLRVSGCHLITSESCG